MIAVVVEKLQPWELVVWIYFPFDFCKILKLAALEWKGSTTQLLLVEPGVIGTNGGRYR